MTSSDNEPDNFLIAMALQYWANYIETSNMTLSIQDVIKMNKPILINELNLNQQKLVIRLRELALKELRK